MPPRTRKSSHCLGPHSPWRPGPQTGKPRREQTLSSLPFGYIPPCLINFGGFACSGASTHRPPARSTRATPAPREIARFGNQKPGTIHLFAGKNSPLIPPVRPISGGLIFKHPCNRGHQGPRSRTPICLGPSQNGGEAPSLRRWPGILWGPGFRPTCSKIRSPENSERMCVGIGTPVLPAQKSPVFP